MARNSFQHRGVTARASAADSGAGFVAQATATAVPFALVLIYALSGSGSYTPVSFERKGIIVWATITFGVVSGLFPRRRPAPSALSLIGALSLYCGWTAVSLIWTDSAQLSFQEVARVVDYIGIVVLLVCIVDRQTWRDSVGGAGLGALCVCVVSVGSRLDPSTFGLDTVDATLHIDRLSVPFGYWNAVAAWGAMCFGFALTWSSHDANSFRRALVLALTPTALVAVYLSYSRAGIAGVVLATVVSVVLSRNRLVCLAHALAVAAATFGAIVVVTHAHQIADGTGHAGAAAVFVALLMAGSFCAATALVTRQQHLRLRLHVPTAVTRRLGITALVVVVLVLTVLGPSAARHAWRSFSNPVPPAAAAGQVSPTARLTTLAGSRYLVWRSALQAFDAHPLDGTGAGTFQYWWNQHATDDETLIDVHNVWLQNLAELGAPGLVAWLLLIMAAVWVLWSARARARRAASAGAAASASVVGVVFLMHATVDWMWESTAVTVFALSLVTLCAGRVSQAHCHPGLWIRMVFAAIAVAAIAVQLPGLLSELDVQASQANAHVGNLPRARLYARAAEHSEPWAEQGYEQMALVDEASGDLRAARRSIDGAIRRAPDDYSVWLTRARIDTEQGQLSLGRADLGEARALAPRALTFTLESSPPTR